MKNEKYTLEIYEVTTYTIDKDKLPLLINDILDAVGVEGGLDGMEALAEYIPSYDFPWGHNYSVKQVEANGGYKFKEHSEVEEVLKKLITEYLKNEE